MPDAQQKLEPKLLHTFACHTDDCCPQLVFNPGADVDKCYEIHDDHGNHIQLSLSQAAIVTGRPEEDIVEMREVAPRDMYRFA